MFDRRTNLVPHVPKKVRHLGLSLSVAEWAKRLGVSRQEVHRRLKLYPVAVALDPDKDARAEYANEGRRAYYLFDGREMTPADIAAENDVCMRTVYNWIEAGKITRVAGRR